MIQYILESIAFQLVCLVIYDFLFKRETFFQWNRAYLIGSYILSMVLPWVKIEALKTTVPQEFYKYPEFMWGVNDAVVAVSGESSFAVSWEYVLLFGGMLLAALLFGFKILQIQRLRKEGEVHFFSDFTKIIISNSNAAFSFFKSVFMGDKILESEQENIIQHELVHIKQRHSWDLFFFELMRIVGWFNPLVYIYQSRISELHEFIADAQVAKTNKKKQYQLLLSKVFQTENISFINQFFKSSLIKKRIVMLQKSKSRKIFKLKYILLMPIILGMLFYSSCEMDTNLESKSNFMEVEDINNMSENEDQRLFSSLKALSESDEYWEFLLKDENSSVKYTSSSNGSFIKFDGHEEKIWATMVIEGPDSIEILGNDMHGIAVSFAVVDEVPVFPGCEGNEDIRACFQKMIMKHISKNFRYPEEAKEKGIQGRVNVMFTIDKDGNIVNIRKRGPHQLLEAETQRIISRLPKMLPGKQNGEKVNVPFSIPITFRLQSSDSDAGYETLKKEQISQLPNDIQMEYENSVAFAEVENAPIFPGCEDASDARACFQTKIQRHISKHFRYPKEAQEIGMQGRVSIIFLIDVDGNITNIAKRGPDKSLEDEAVRIISKLPKMQPGEHQGKNVNVPFSIPITFKLR